MHPQMIHQTTTKAPDSGMKLGFGTPATVGGRNSIAVMQNTPSKAAEASSDAKSIAKSAYEFKFRSASHLSNEAQALMDNLRDEAARIKEQMKEEKNAQEERDAEAADHFQGFGAAGRKIAKPKGKAGRFSDVHMEAFKKMDSIANHASAFRAINAPGFAQPTAQSLKRSPSKAGLDELARPQTAAKGTPTRRPPPSRLPNRRPLTVSPFKSLPKLPQEESPHSPAKRQRQSEFGDVSTARPQRPDQEEKFKPSTLPRPVSRSGVPHSLLAPTKSTLSRSNSTKVPLASIDKPSMLPHSQSTKSLHPTRPSTGTPFKTAVAQEPRTAQASPVKFIPTSASKIPRSESTILNRPLPPLPTAQISASHKSNGFSLKLSESTKTLASPTKTQSLASRLPTFAGLKSILRPSRPQGLQTPAIPERVGTSKRHNTANATDSAKKVDFTPSVKSRYAVKLAADSPSPAKLHHDTPRPAFDPTAYMMSDDTVEEEWEDAEEDAEAESEVVYPTLPSTSPSQKSPSVKTVQAFMQKAKEVGRRESLDFKSIAANGIRPVHDNPFPMTAFNTTVNKVTKSPVSASKPSPATIRRVRPSNAHEMVKLFNDSAKNQTHVPVLKKRPHDSDKHGRLDDPKENRRPSQSPTKVPGGWEDSVLEEDEGDKRGGKRVRIQASEEPAVLSPQKKTPGREAAAKAAKDRKKGGILSMSRLNMLARPRGQ
jgi:hypothetical protein